VIEVVGGGEPARVDRPLEGRRGLPDRACSAGGDLRGVRRLRRLRLRRGARRLGRYHDRDRQQGQQGALLHVILPGRDSSFCSTRQDARGWTLAASREAQWPLRKYL